MSTVICDLLLVVHPMKPIRHRRQKLGIGLQKSNICSGYGSNTRASSLCRSYIGHVLHRIDMCSNRTTASVFLVTSQIPRPRLFGPKGVHFACDIQCFPPSITDEIKLTTIFIRHEVNEMNDFDSFH